MFKNQSQKTAKSFACNQITVKKLYEDEEEHKLNTGNFAVHANTVNLHASQRKANGRFSFPISCEMTMTTATLGGMSRRDTKDISFTNDDTVYSDRMSIDSSPVTKSKEAS